MILGLDISTSIVGATILDEQNNILYCEAWDLRKVKNFFEKGLSIKNKLTDVKKQHAITKIAIEKPFVVFRSMRGSSGATMAKLQSFNGAVSWMCYDIFGLEAEYISPQAARKLCNIKISRGQKSKEVVLNFVLDNVDGFGVQYTKHGNPVQGSFDRADSYVIARATLIQCQQN
jgi:Holliday junction resolvasome RuvABC endonuclease subunit